VTRQSPLVTRHDSQVAAADGSTAALSSPAARRQVATSSSYGPSRAVHGCEINAAQETRRTDPVDPGHASLSSVSEEVATPASQAASPAPPTPGRGSPAVVRSRRKYCGLRGKVRRHRSRHSHARQFAGSASVPGCRVTGGGWRCPIHPTCLPRPVDTPVSSASAAGVDPPAFLLWNSLLWERDTRELPGLSCQWLDRSWRQHMSQRSSR
jgi:hypothetical protein